MSVQLPHTWRPFGARLVGTALGLMLVGLVVATWILLGPATRAKFSPLEIGTLIFLGLIAFGVWFALMRSRVVAREDVLVVVNGYRKRQFEWAQVVGVSMRRGAPWAVADLSDGTAISMLGIQSADGERAVRAVATLRELATRQTAP